MFLAILYTTLFLFLLAFGGLKVRYIFQLIRAKAPGVLSQVFLTSVVFSLVGLTGYLAFGAWSSLS